MTERIKLKQQLIALEEETQTKIAELTDTILEIAETARRIAGARYATTIEVWLQLIRFGMRRYNCNALVASARMLKDLQEKGYDGADTKIWLTAAAVDITTGEGRG